MTTVPSATVPPLTPLAAIMRSERAEAQSGAVVKSKRIEFLDVLRGLAAFVVLCQHSLEGISIHFAQWSREYINLGEVGVVIFFVVSGFIIPVSIEKYNSLSRFWLGRFLRLWPSYLTSLFIAVLLTSQHVPTSRRFRDLFAVHPVKAVLGNFTMIAEYIHIPFAIGASWTLALELLFYVLCSVLFLFGVMRRAWTWLWLSLVALLISQLTAAIVAHKSLPAGNLGLIVTALFGTLLYRQKSNHDTQRMLLRVLPALFFVLAVSFWVRIQLYPPAETAPYLVEHPGWLCTFLSWTIAYTVFLAVYFLRSSRFPRILTWVGQISYPLYLFQALVLAAVPKTLASPVYLVATFGTSLFSAHLIHLLIEKPVEKFQRKVLAPGPVGA